jgi:glycosyltransferase involved in cell wall biosynthesis
LLSLREAKRRGAVAVLEHPMVHIAEWMSSVREEYERWRTKAARYPNIFPRSLVRRMEREYREADHIVVLSRFARDTFVERGVNEKKLLSIPLGVDVDHFRPMEVSPTSCFRVIYVGRMELIKGVHYLLQAFAELNLPEAELWLVGPALPEIEPFFRLYKGAYRHFGEIRHAELPQYYGASTLTVLPSISDGFGLVILEAMACGLPVVATDHTGAADLIEDGIHGFIVPIRDVKALKDRLVYLYGHRAEALSMGARARERVMSSFTSERYGQRLLEAYSVAVESRRHAQPLA